MNRLLDIFSIVTFGPAAIVLLYKLFTTPDEIPSYHMRLMVIFLLMYHLLFLAERLITILDGLVKGKDE